MGGSFSSTLKVTPPKGFTYNSFFVGEPRPYYRCDRRSLCKANPQNGLFELPRLNPSAGFLIPWYGVEEGKADDDDDLIPCYGVGGKAKDDDYLIPCYGVEGKADDDDDDDDDDDAMACDSVDTFADYLSRIRRSSLLAISEKCTATKLKYWRSHSKANPQSGSFELPRLNPSSDSAAAAATAAVGGGGSGGSANPTGHSDGPGGGGQGSSLALAVSGGGRGGDDGNQPNFNQEISLKGLFDVLLKFLHAFSLLLYHLLPWWRVFTGRGNDHEIDWVLASTNLYNAVREFLTALADLISYTAALRANNSGVLPALFCASIGLYTLMYFFFLCQIGHFP